MNNRNRIETKRLVLRSFELSDAKRVQELAGDYEIAKTTLNIPHPYEDGMAEYWINQHKEQENVLTYAIVSKDTNELMGAINLMIKPAHKKAEMAYWVGVPYWGKGYCTEAAKALIHKGFTEHGLNKIYALSFVTNAGSYTVMEKCGMKYEGLRHQDVIKDGVTLDLKSYYILRDDYMNNL